eukprot:824409-Amphidinium_carterae.1
MLYLGIPNPILDLRSHMLCTYMYRLDETDYNISSQSISCCKCLDCSFKIVFWWRNSLRWLLHDLKQPWPWQGTIALSPLLDNAGFTQGNAFARFCARPHNT